jgi:hypothetical protein
MEFIIGDLITNFNPELVDSTYFDFLTMANDYTNGFNL